MLPKFVICFTIITAASCTYCSEENAVKLFKRSTYDFSIRILDRVAQETASHFVYTPLSTWLQVLALSEGARGKTQSEIHNAMKYPKTRCLKQSFLDVIHDIDKKLAGSSKRSSVIAINKLLDVKRTYKDKIMKMNTTKLLTVDFKSFKEAAEKINGIIKTDTNGVISEGVYDDDFNLTMIILLDTAYFKSNWLTPFDSLFTSNEAFYSEDNIKIGSVNMMRQVGSYNLVEVSQIGAQILELPFESEDMSMLIVLPTNGTVNDLFFSFENIRLTTIFNLFKAEGKRLVTIKVPRFKIKTEIDNVAELLYDLGLTKMFYPDLADLGGISDYKVHASLMIHKTEIEVTERGTTAANIAEFLIKDRVSSKFTVNRPFAYLIVDKKSEVILFGGIYCNPSIY